ncbi:hypothetical protein CXZ10_04480 [Pleomorphomonas diazotrophica]|uniref:Secreted protein n=1 Tax=Pleomorphomonas diazotrophica TaxID=1166257 RepID=A0A1I4QJ80_9HYPH|nr:hypothetical protein CXZ10_04480 [Pleomorphomonas diazotrophica]SFM40084.1 hypothetical protein SAMN05192571_101418 [Pleomorphomonas diazotrophica]
MTSRPLRLSLAFLATLIAATSTFAAERRHQLIEPIQPDRRQQEREVEPASVGKLCYCRTVHERNAVGRLTWKVVCSEKKPERGSRKIRAPDCRVAGNLLPP